MRWSESKIHNHLDKFPFGMYENKSLGYVLEKDPEYFLFLEKRFKQFKIATGLMKDVYILTDRNPIDND